MNTEKKQWISDKSFFWLVLALSLTVPALVTLLRYLPDEFRPAVSFAKGLPKLNAVINSLVSVCLVLGVYFIRVKKDKATHQKFMLSAFILSTVFLLSYVTYHFTVPHVAFCKEGWIKSLYLVILFTHIVLAALIMPMILYTIYFSSTGKFDKHRKWAKVTFPLWLYVSVTGVVVYLMLSPCLNVRL
jgi:putative membrane protein